MAKTCTTSVAVSVTGDSVDESFSPPALSNAAAPAGGPVDVALSTGDNSISVPPGALGFVLVPPTTSTVAKKLKGAGGDSGFPIATALISVLSIPAGTATIIINAASGETVAVHWI